MKNCYFEDCLNLNINLDGYDRCNVIQLDSPQDKMWNCDCEHFRQSQTCRECEHGRLKFYCNEEYDFEEDYRCKLDKSIYVCYTSVSQRNHDYQCKNGKFKLND